MDGQFSDVFIWVMPQMQDGSAWSIDSKQVSYHVVSEDVVTLQITRRRPIVKVEHVESGVAGMPPLVKAAESVASLGSAEDLHSSFDKQKPLTPAGSKRIFEVIVAQAGDKPANDDASIESASSSGHNDEPSSAKDVGRKVRKCNAKLCSVTGCTKFGHGKPLPADDLGPCGRRCVRHGGGVKCAAEGCTMRATSARCVRHGGGTRCSVADCNSFSQGKSLVADQFGPPGYRCVRHGASHRAGPRCTEVGCSNYAVGGSRVDGMRRCIRHGGGRRCNVEGCQKFCVGRNVTEADKFGVPGGRCRLHHGSEAASAASNA